MPAPTLSVVKNRGSGSVQVFPLLTGTSLGSQDGSNVGGASFETGATLRVRATDRMIEAFGKRFIAVGSNIFERDQGGSGNWGSVHARSGGVHLSGSAQSGLHLIHPGDVPTLAGLYANTTTGETAKTTSIDGVSFSDDTTLGLGGHNPTASGHSIAFRNSIFWWNPDDNANSDQLVEHNFLTDASVAYSLAGTTNTQQRSACFAIVDNELYLIAVDTDNVANIQWEIFKLSGASWVSMVTLAVKISTGAAGAEGHEGGACAWADGSDLIVFVPGLTLGNSAGDQFFRVKDPGGSPSVTDISSLLLTAGNGGDVFLPGGGSAVAESTWDVDIDNNTNPEFPTVHLWRYSGPGNAGTREAFTFEYRQITHGAVTGGPFVAGETVTQTTSGATGKVVQVGGGFLSLTDVTGTFDAVNTLTGGTSGATATATSLLIEQPLTSDGSSISADFALPMSLDGIGLRIPAKPAPRVELGDASNPSVEVVGGTKHFFRCYGTGSPVVITLYYSEDEEAPNKIATLTGAVTVESGSPATTPVRSGNTITNLTPDDGVALYSLIHDATTDGINTGDTYGLSAKAV